MDLSMLIPAFRHRQRGKGFIAATLTLGIGVATSLFTVADALMLRGPAGVADPGRLFVWSGQSNYVELQKLQRTLPAAQLAGLSRTEFDLAGGAIGVTCVTPNYFAVVGVAPQRGRFFSHAEDANAIVLSDALWQRLGAPALGSRVAFSQATYTVIGVAQRAFAGLDFSPTAAWITLEGSPAACSFTGTNLLRSDDSYWLEILGRLSADATFAQVELQASAAMSQPRHLADSKQQGPRISSLLTARSRSLGRIARTTIWLGVGSAVLVTIVILNLCSLFGLRSIRKQDDVTIRLQLGASRSRLVRDIYLENASLVAMCALPSMLVAYALTTVLTRFFPVSAGTLLTPRSMLVAAAVSVAIALLTAIAPAAQVLRAKPDQFHVSFSQRPRQRLAASAIVAAQIAIAISLTVLGDLYVRSLGGLQTNTGYELGRLLLIEADAKALVPADGLATLQQRIDALPVVESSAAGSGLLIASRNAVRKMPIRGAGSSERASVFLNVVQPNYFSLVGTNILSGRNFADTDGPGSEPVAILSYATARKLWPSGDAVGRCLSAPRLPCLRIIGLTEERRAWLLTEATDEVFLPVSQVKLLDPKWQPTSLLVRTSGNAARHLGSLVRVASEAAQPPAIVRVETLSNLASEQLKAWRVGAALFGLFGVTALLLSAIGVYATYSLQVFQRTAEFAVRAALGATPANIARIVFAQCAVVSTLGTAAGVAGGYAAARTMSSMWFDTAAADPRSYVVATTVVSIAAVLGVWAPTLRATRSNPATLTRTA